MAFFRGMKTIHLFSSKIFYHKYRAFLKKLSENPINQHDQGFRLENKTKGVYDNPKSKHWSRLQLATYWSPMYSISGRRMLLSLILSPMVKSNNITPNRQLLQWVRPCWVINILKLPPTYQQPKPIKAGNFKNVLPVQNKSSSKPPKKQLSSSIPISSCFVFITVLSWWGKTSPFSYQNL